jgi:DNA-binding LacI/PurR family transcriptional regulator
MIQKDLCWQSMEPHFFKALEDDKITAWVCSNEITAAVATEFLKGRNQKVPKDISVIGFDTGEESLMHHITSYRFPKERLGYLAVHCMTGDIPVNRDRKGTVVCPGEIIVRESTGRARA